MTLLSFITPLSICNFFRLINFPRHSYAHISIRISPLSDPFFFSVDFCLFRSPLQTHLQKGSSYPEFFPGKVSNEIVLDSTTI